MLLRTEEAYDFLVDQLARIPADINRHALVSTRYAHLYFPDLVTRFWQARGSAILFGDMTDDHFRPFYDAAWELIAGLGSAAAWPVVARAQQPAMPVVGFVHAGSADGQGRLLAAFQKGLGETGRVPLAGGSIRSSVGADGRSGRIKRNGQPGGCRGRLATCISPKLAMARLASPIRSSQ
jgi:hypothetical protein